MKLYEVKEDWFLNFLSKVFDPSKTYNSSSALAWHETEKSEWVDLIDETYVEILAKELKCNMRDLLFVREDIDDPDIEKLIKFSDNPRTRCEYIETVSEDYNEARDIKICEYNGIKFAYLVLWEAVEEERFFVINRKIINEVV